MRWIAGISGWIDDRLEDLARWVSRRLLGLDRIAAGVVESLFVVALLAVPVSFGASKIPAPTADLCSQLAEIGVVLVLAYVLEAVWLVSRFATNPRDDEYEARVGTVTGFGFAGMAGVVAALLLSAHRAAGHDNLLDVVALGWIVPSLTVLAGMVVFQPLLAHDWRSPPEGT